MQLPQICLHTFHSIRCRFANLTYRKIQVISQALRAQHDNNRLLGEDWDLDVQDKKEYEEISQDYLGRSDMHRVCVLQPYIKWGKRKRYNTTPELQLAEAVALVNTLSGWKVVEKRLIPLLTLQQKKLLGSGALEKLKTDLQRNGTVSAVFISTNKLKFVQQAELQKELQLPIYDRYSLIIHIFRQHATTVEAKLQVAMAELPYVRRKMQELVHYRAGRINLNEKTKLVLERRESKLKAAMKKLQLHRQVISERRKKLHLPTVAIIGYTNAGKTSLIKALTQKKELTPENKLFATLDITVHEGILPCSMKVLFVDTIGFIQDVPETLIEPFNVTLRDAINADVIVHVYDASHPDMQAQVTHVKNTLKKILKDRTIIEVANKCDIQQKNPLPEDVLQVSAVKEMGLDNLLEKIEREVILATGTTITKIKVKSGSPESSWLYKETTVVNVDVDPANPEFVIMQVIAAPSSISKFQHMMRNKP